MYIITNKGNSTLYIGVTNNLERRMYEHQHGLHEGFSKQYNLHKLVYWELGSSIKDAIAREKQLKNWSRKSKIKLIESMSPNWEDLSKAFVS